jgi:hypothetical protein
MLMPNSIPEILHRFDNFNDSVIETISVDYLSGAYPRLQVVLNCQDDFDPRMTRRQCVLDFQEAKEFKLVQPLKTSWEVISFGIAVIVEAGLTYVDFDCLGDSERTIQQVHAGGFYIAAGKVEFTVR